MTVRLLAMLLTLFGLTVAVVLLAWSLDAELYFLLPRHPRHGIEVDPPPTHPLTLLFLLLVVVVVALFSPHYGLVSFSLFPVGLVLGSIFGFAGFEWTPSWAQHLLTVVSIVAVAYGWKEHAFLDY